VLHCVVPADSDVAVTGERSREERDAEGRKRAIDLDAPVSSLVSTATKSACEARR
jgi:hypothetical protein